MELRAIPLLHEGLWAVLLFLIAVGGFYVLVARSSSAALGATIARSLASFFISPVGYLRKTAQDLALGKSNPRLRDTDHYLLSRFITNVQVGLIVGVVIGAALVVTAAVFSSLPSPFMRERVSRAENELRQAESAAEKTEKSVKQQDDDWQSRRADLVRNLEEEAHKKVKAAQDAVAADEATLQNGAETARVLPSLKTFFQSREGDPSAAEQAKIFVQRLPSLSEADDAALMAYCDHWAALQSVPASVPKNDAVLRTRIQPDHIRLTHDLERQKAEVEDLQNGLTNLRKELQAEYKPENFGTTMLTGSILILVYIWGIGLAIELFSLGFYLSNDVKQIRSQVEKPDLKGVAAAAGVGK